MVSDFVCTCVASDSLLIFKFQSTTYCYRPPRASASAKVKRQEMPDAEKWTSYEMRIFSSTGVRVVNYSKHSNHKI